MRKTQLCGWLLSYVQQSQRRWFSAYVRYLQASVTFLTAPCTNLSDHKYVTAAKAAQLHFLANVLDEDKKKEPSESTLAWLVGEQREGILWMH